MLLSRSTGRKVLVTAAAAVTFASLYEVTTLDSRNATRELELRDSTALPSPGTRLRFSVTGYCKGTTTASGVNVRTGIAASDPGLLPVGSVIQIDKLGDRYNGIYTIMTRYALKATKSPSVIRPLMTSRLPSHRTRSDPSPRKKVMLGKNMPWRRISPRLRRTYSAFASRKRASSWGS